MQVAGNHGEHSRHQRWTQEAGFLTERVAEGDREPRLRGGQGSVCRGAERAGNGLVESG